MSKELFPPSTGSATGNPRNKTALKPGYSLMGWIRLTGSGEDLTGLRGRTVNVSKQELAKHNTNEDCWMAIRGKVYNVTRYLEFHPGGAEQLMRGAGKDATSLFDEYHAWVNIESLLKKCFIGPLRNTATVNLSPDEFFMRAPSKSLLSALSPTRTRPVLANGKTIDENSSNKNLSALSLESSKKKSSSSTNESVENVPVIPRFDWIQKTTELAIFFYTKAYCNPGILLRYISDKNVEIHIFIANTVDCYKFTFLKSLKWPCTARLNCESGKVEIIFKKEQGEVWTNFGIYEKAPVSEGAVDAINEDFKIVSRRCFNHDSFEMRLRPLNQLMMKMPIGSHVNFLHHVSPTENQITRSYTPVPRKYASSNISDDSVVDLLFIIKTYENGALSSRLKASEELIQLSLKPKGALNLYRIRNCTKFAMLAAGSGITPMYSVLDHLLERRENRVESLTLLYFNKTESDVWTKEQLENVVKTDDRFKVEHIFSNSQSSSPQARSLTKEVVQEVMKVSEFMFICGPTKFNDLAASYYREIMKESSSQVATADVGDAEEEKAFWIFQ